MAVKKRKQGAKAKVAKKRRSSAAGAGKKAAKATTTAKAATRAARPKRPAKSAPAPTANPPSAQNTFDSEQVLRAFQMKPVADMLTAQPAAGATSPAFDINAALALAQPTASSHMLPTRLSATPRQDPARLAVLPIRVSPAMDPRLQLALANASAGKRGLEITATAGDEVAVIARVKSVDQWEGIVDVDPGANLGAAPDDTCIVTGRIPIKRIEAIRADPNVVSLKAAQPVYPSLAATIASMAVDAGALPAGTNPKGGAGVVVGIIDFGCDFVHANFRKPNGETRIQAIWHQGISTVPNGGVKYGRLYTQANIDNALKTANPYVTLNYGPKNEPGGTHGTHVMDIAAGNGNGTGQAGVAPEADLIFVELSATDVAWEGPNAIQNFFGDSAQLLEAVRFVFDTAGDRPCVVNLSLGTNGGPHDGTSLTEHGLDAIVNEKPNRAIVIAAGNSHADGIHTSGTVAGDQVHKIGWRQDNAGGGEFELWYPGDRRLEVTLVAPDGTRLGPVAPNANLTLGSPGEISIFISCRLSDPNNGDNAIGIWMAAGLSEEDFTIELRSLDAQPVDYHAWIERDDKKQSAFRNPVFTHTLGSISTGRQTIVVSSHDAHKPSFPISTFSSAGPTRDGREKPELTAPGQFVIAAKSGSGNGSTKKSGTSMAAPAVTGLIALMLAEATRQGTTLTIDQIRTKLQTTARRDPAGMDPQDLAPQGLNPQGLAPQGWDPRYGFGRAHGGAVR